MKTWTVILGFLTIINMIGAVMNLVPAIMTHNLSGAGGWLCSFLGWSVVLARTLQVNYYETRTTK
jgi:predicted PurR-regulated permease PerM